MIAHVAFSSVQFSILECQGVLDLQVENERPIGCNYYISEDQEVAASQGFLHTFTLMQMFFKIILTHRSQEFVNPANRGK